LLDFFLILTFSFESLALHGRGGDHSLAMRFCQGGFCLFNGAVFVTQRTG